MDKIDKLTPVIVLVTATMINHCCKEKKELSLSEFLIILSPSVPTVVPILISIITDFCTSSYEYLKTLEYLKFIFLIFDFLKPKKCEKIVLKQNEKKIKEKHDIHTGFDIIRVSSDLMFTQLLVSYIENNTDTCTYEISKDGKQFKLLKDRSITEKEIWKNIKIKFGKIEICLDNLEIMFKKSYGKIVLSDFSHSMLFDEEKPNLDNAKVIRLTDIINCDGLKSYINKYHEANKTKYETFEKKQKDMFLKHIKDTGYFEYCLIENLHDIFPNVDKLLFLADFYILASLCQNTAQSLMSVIKTSFSKTGKITLFDVEIPIKKIPSYSLFTDSKDLSLFFSMVGTSSTALHPTNEVLNDVQNYINKILLMCSVIELKKKTGKDENILVFYAKLNTENQKKENNFKIISGEFNNFIEKIKNFDVVQSNENKIKIFNTTIERIEKNPEEKKHGHGPYNFHANKNVHKNEGEDEDTEEKINDENKENKNNKDTDTDTDTDSDPDSDKNKNADKIKSKNDKTEKNKKYKGKKHGNLTRSYPAYNYYDHYNCYDVYELYNTKEKKEPEKEAVVSIKEINEKYKSIDTLYLRESDYRRLVNILSRFKNSSHLYDKYGLPNKLGVLLYGEPGTGKSTTIQVIGSYLQKNIYYVNLSTVETNNELQMIFDEINLSMNGGIIVFEDIDAMSSIVYNRNVSTVSEGDKLTLEYFLNLLQGSLTRDGTIFIATTNHLEKLDPAFYRVGRFDIKIDMKKCDHFQIKTIYEKFVGKSINNDVLKKIPCDKYTPAEIIFHLVNYIDSEDPDEIIMKDFIFE